MKRLENQGISWCGKQGSNSTGLYILAEGVNEELKVKDQLAWVDRTNNIRRRAEEIVLEELVYA